MGSAAKEVLTLQIGHYSNHIGCHWWNIQEAGFDYTGERPSDISNDVLFREGVNPKGQVTYTPRLLLVDRKGSLNHLRKRGDLYEDIKSPDVHDVVWKPEKVDVVVKEKTEKNEFLADLENEPMDQSDTTNLKVYNLDDQVNVWSDFMRTRYHPNTISIINEYDHDNSDQFNMFHEGLHLWKTNQFEEEFTDHIRHFVEECDNLQGFQIVADVLDGFSGLTASALEYLQDEYTKKASLVFPAIPSTLSNLTPAVYKQKIVNLALACSAYSEHSSLIVPLCLGSLQLQDSQPVKAFEYIEFKNNLAYHTSAMFALALDTLTLPYRLQTDQCIQFDEFLTSLNRYGRKFAAASIGVPFKMYSDAYLLETLEKWEGPLWHSLTPNCSIEQDRIWVQAVSLRGIGQNRLHRPSLNTTSLQDSNNPAYTCKTVQEMLRLFLSCCSYATFSQVYTSNFACKVVSPFPRIFSPYVGIDGSINTSARTDTYGVYSVPTISGIHSCKSVGEFIKCIHTEASKIHHKRLYQSHSAAGLETAELEECLNHLADIQDSYQEEFDV